jgi:Protein of unknown function (DUF805)
MWTLAAAVILFGSALLWLYLESWFMVVPGVLVAVSLWVPACVRRLHDRNKPAVWVLLAVVPVIGTIWSIVELGFRRGTPGRNRYGRPVAAVDVVLPIDSFETESESLPRLRNAMWNQPLLLGRRPETRACPSCNRENDITSMFCDTCGDRLDAGMATRLQAS